MYGFDAVVSWFISLHFASFYHCISLQIFITRSCLLRKHTINNIIGNRLLPFLCLLDLPLTLSVKISGDYVRRLTAGLEGPSASLPNAL